MDRKTNKLIPTEDDWYPCFDGNKVVVTLVCDNKRTFRVTVWGNDDFGMEKVFADLGEARKCYRNLTIANKKTLKAAGFVLA